jgi:hypothetical protein
MKLRMEFDEAPDCPLCAAASIQGFFRDARRRYFRCDECGLVFADPASHLLPAAEKALYRQHQNDSGDPEYRRFLRRLADPLLGVLENRPLQGLDFGCGPGPTLSVMLEEHGHAVSIYDPYFFPDRGVLMRRYDFVTCTEAIEHFYRPCKEWSMLVDRVTPGGWLAIMTRFVPEVDAFSRWHYKNDPTHVSFFSKHTFGYLAARDGLHLRFAGSGVALFNKRG